MPAVHDGASRQRAIPIQSVFFALVAPSALLMAQSAHPFAAPTTTATFSLSAVASVADLNRDGSPDVIVPGLFYGTMTTALDENGGALAANGTGPGITPPPGAPSMPRPAAMVCGKLDQDDLEDLVTVSTCGSTHFHRNLGSTLLGGANFAPDVCIDDFRVRYPVNPPFVHFWFPCAQVVDLDQDGFQDVLVAGGPIDRWGASTRPGFICVYKGDGAGGFTIIRHHVPGSIVDAEFADLDNNGTPDHVVALMETGSVGAFGYDILHLALVNGALVATTPPQSVGPGKLTALELADVTGDANNDYILAQTSASGGTISAQVYYFQGDGLGNVSSSFWGTFALPPNMSGLGDYISSIDVGDFNRDSHVDIAMLRGFVQPQSPTAAAPATYANSEVLVAMGPAVVYAPLESIALPGYHSFSSTNSTNFSLLPLFGEPECLRAIDLGRDSSPDFLIPGLRVLGPSGGTMIATLKNTTPPVFGDARFEKVGDPSGGAPSRPARLGFEGGRPRPGNTNFACTTLNVQGGSLVGLMWGQVGIANLFSAH
ncbi:MAG TPA: FG-GAP-like repeat-containing protein, partial [Planctomycetota bacterium]|nr:FG-GAP-like repeat-containing protein [Planctomycetota bacterium]